MAQTKIMKELENVLKKREEKYFIDGVLNKAQVIEDLHNYNPELLSILSKNEIVRKHFILNIEDNQIIKINELIEIFEMNEYWDNSYTAYENKIGLSSSEKFLSDSEDVVLDFPYKDTVLKASMSKEERENEDLLPKEPFLNEKIAREEIDRLFDEKILTSVKKYDSNGNHEITEFSDEDNLVIKGNNLLALHTLKERYTEKVKLIYIDPPYNTGNDSFQYNDNFNHSTWLIFMKNRLEISKYLLHEAGVIFIQCDDNEAAYLKVLMDEIYGKDNFITDFIWIKKTGASDATHIATITEHILAYAKNDSIVKINQNLESYDKNRYRLQDEYVDLRGPFYYDTLDRGGLRYSDSLNYGIEMPDGKKLYPNNRYEFVNDGWTWKWSKDKVKWGLENDFCDIIKRNGEYTIRYKVYLKVDNEGNPIDRSAPYKNLISGVLNTHATSEIKKLFGHKVFATPKPEQLIERLIRITTNKGDMILDFFMGSATTQAVAMKMNRRFIGIEQMDYINEVSVPRLQKVIEGEQGGISKDVNWQGGGSFVYAELMEKNTGYLKDIAAAESTDELRKIFDLMLEYADFDFRVDLEEVKGSIWKLPLEDQKKELIRIIDKNQLYYNYSEIDDNNVRNLISDSDYAFNKSFYNERVDMNE